MKKTMKIWHLILIIVMILAMTCTMFLPAIQVNKKTMKKAFLAIVEDMDWEDADETKEEAKQEVEDGADYIEEYTDNLNEAADLIWGVNLKSVKPITIMTKSFKNPLSALFNTDKATDKKSSGIAKLKIVLWIIYMAGLLVLIFNILAFVLKLNKFIPLSINTVYGLISAGVFGFLRFGMVGMLAKKMKYFTDFINGTTGLSQEVGDSTKLLKDFLGAFVSYAFLVAMIFAIIFVIVNIVAMLTGNKVTSVNEEDDDDYYGNDTEYPVNDDDYPEYNPNDNTSMATEVADIPTMGADDRMGFGGIQQPIAPPIQQPIAPPIQQVPPIPVTPAMGTVRCTRGAAIGQALSLPERNKVVVGRSMDKTKVNFQVGNPHVSDIHCSIRYNAAKNTYIVKDHSSNGTFVNSVRLQKNVPMEYPAGTVLLLADGSTEITLG